ncbi:DUF6212 domain-containing protein [Microvirga puerhi]|uniref:Uncharacterized protein n=1 Tax=Microvirga puerhi TaxID=2876078 RepID=A0ABS7VTF5_9HYPH|nr:DUF6212 domain-containing protein [Microvirga puerhi]MBZ6078421.1 hypothetical protein [Microvirga puerhi]
MIIYAEKACFPSLYEALPKLLLLGSPESVTELNEQFLWLAIYRDCQDRIVLTSANRQPMPQPELLPLEVPPANVWAMWVPAVGDEGIAKSLMQWWAAEGGDATVPVLVHGDRATLDRTLLARSLHERSRLVSANERLLCDLAALRESFETHIRIPREVEELLENLRLAPLRLVLTNPVPTSDISVPMYGPMDRPSGEGASIRQRLPISAHGFAGLDLSITHPGTGEGQLHLDLIVRDEGLTLATWRAPFHKLHRGLLPVRLGKVMTQHWRSLELHIAAEGAGDPPRLAIAPTGLLPEYSLIPAMGADAQPEPSMLVMRLWGGLPGVVTSVRGNASALGLPPPNPVIPIDETSIAGVRLTREINASYPCFGHLGGDRVLLRPFPNKVSAAVVALPAIAHLVAVSCSVAVDEKRCETRKLGARLVVMAPGHSPDEAERGAGALAVSEWVELDHPLEARTLKARLSEPHQGPLDLHLFTRLPKGGAIQHVRMVFQGFEAEIQEHAIGSMSTLLPCSEEERPPCADNSNIRSARWDLEAMSQ